MTTYNNVKLRYVRFPNRHMTISSIENMCRYIGLILNYVSLDWQQMNIYFDIYLDKWIKKFL